MDPDRDSELDAQMERDDKMISKFRMNLQKIKVSIQNKYTLNTQDVTVLNTINKELTQFFEILNPIIFLLKSINTIPDKLIDLRNNFSETLEDYPRSSYYQHLLQYYLIHDLLKYPMDNNIVQNNIELTKV
jgi:hypothetical protein